MIYILDQMQYGGGAGGGGYVILSSRLLSRDIVANNYNQVAPLLINCNASFNCVLFVFSLVGWLSMIHTAPSLATE